MCKRYVTAVYAIPIGMSDIAAEFQEHCPRGEDGKRFTVVMKEPFRDTEEDLNEIADVCLENAHRVYLKDIFQAYIIDDGDIPIKFGDTTFGITYKKNDYDNRYEVYSDFQKDLYITIPLKQNTLETAKEKFQQLTAATGITGTPEKYVEVLFG